uniref:Uncharacterized protein n=2 Tax=unclassified bacterial viruses TaxID=12333 RepID=A0A8S5R6H0_9VIRU|nr:MAG TPA: hypothetical protein [virus sp. cthq354]DAE27625.1 MAG TPA: hypothetical protein [virus sp. ctf7E27]
MPVRVVSFFYGISYFDKRSISSLICSITSGLAISPSKLNTIFTVL